MEKTVVIKCGGSVLSDLSPSFFTSLQAMYEQGMNVVLVHGGGPEIGKMLERLHVHSEFVNGLRKTTKEVLEVVEMILAGKVNKQLVALLQQYGLPAVGVSGVDACLLQAAPIDLEKLGYVGKVVNVNGVFVDKLLQSRYIPVISPIGTDKDGQKYNINADTAAGAVAKAIKAAQLLFVTDVPGILRDGAVVEQATIDAIERMINEGVITGGMIPKVKAAIAALSESLHEVMIVSGKAPFYENGQLYGTTIRNEVGGLLMGALFPTYNRWNICVKSAEGTTVTDTNGKQYLDFVSGIAVCNLGHRHPAVQKAIEEQLNRFWHVSNLFTIELQEEVAELLVANSCGDYVFFCNSGAEANEAALKLARKHTGRHKVITFRQSFHGRTFATMSATGQEKVYKGFGPLLPEFVHLPFNDIKALENEMSEDVAAVMVEIVQGEGGVRPADAAFLQKIAELCKQYGALFIVDEVQTGIGRTGKPFAYQHFAIEPDIITSAKGLGSGIPVGAMIGKAFLKDTFTAGVHGSTFGGNPIAMAAAKATLQIIFQPDFLQEVQEKGDYFLARLQEALSEFKLVKEVRGLGLLVGIECGEDVAKLIPAIHENGLLVLTAGPNVIRLLPPLIVSKEELDQAVKVIKQTIQEVKTAAAK